jgi:hypothetical protein
MQMAIFFAFVGGGYPYLRDQPGRFPVAASTHVSDAEQRSGSRLFFLSHFDHLP